MGYGIFRNGNFDPNRNNDRVNVSFVAWVILLLEHLNPNRAGLLDVGWVQGGGWISPHLLDHPKTLWKNKFFSFFSWRNSHLEEVRADSVPPALLGLSVKTPGRNLEERWRFDRNFTVDLEWFFIKTFPSGRVETN